MSEQHSDTNRALLAVLADGPPRHVSVSWSNPARHAASHIRAHLSCASQDDTASVSFEDLHEWRSRLDDALDHLARTNPALWSYWRQPGTWLDSLLRLRSLLAHVLAKAYWDDRPAVPYADMDIPRFLWGAR